MTAPHLLLLAVGGLATAAYLFIVAAGLSLVFGALRVINMAHGSLYMIAAFVTVVVADRLGLAFGFWGGLLAGGSSSARTTGPSGRRSPSAAPSTWPASATPSTRSS